MIKIVAALEKHSKGIGYDNMLPWPVIPEDMQHFRSITLNNTIAMGSETFNSFGNIPLPKRKNIVITRKKRDYPKGVIQIHDPIELLKIKEPIYIIGGSSIFSMFISYAKEMYITELEFDELSNLRFDRFFPFFAKDEWKVSGDREKFRALSGNVSYKFLKYSRIK